MLQNLYAVSKSSKDFRPPQGGNLVAVVKAQRRRSDELDFHVGASLCACSKAGPNIATIRRIEVSPGVADEPRRGRPAAAAQDLMGAEPRLRVFLIRIRDKSWIRHEVVSGPLPDIADHLTTTKRAVACSMGADFNDSVLPVKICLGHLSVAYRPRENDAVCCSSCNRRELVLPMRQFPILLRSVNAVRPKRKTLPLRTN